MPEMTPTPVPTVRPPPAAAVAAAWPADVPSDADADGILCAGLAGLAAADDAALDATIAALTGLEQDALSGALAAPDPAPIRNAATLRYRISTAIATAPAAGAPIDADAGRALLGEIDAVLAAVAALDAGPRAAELEAVRRVLVKDAVDLSELLQHRTPVEADAVPAPVAPASAPRPPQPTTRVIATSAAEPSGSRSVVRWVVLAVAVVAAGGYHAARWWRLQHAPAANVAFDAPAGYHATPGASGGPAMLVPTGGPTDPAALAAFEAQQRMLGREVRELPGGTILIQPRRAAAHEEAR